MSLDNIVAGDYGQIIKLTFIDVDTDEAADISGYNDTQHMLLKDPAGNEAPLTAAFDSDGSDGIIKYTVADGDIDEGGIWKIRGRAIDTGNKILTTEEKSFKVLD